jgi:hypothetical protein
MKSMVKAGALVIVTLATGCANPGKATGGGSLVDGNGNKIASIGFNVDTCSGGLGNPTGRFNYVDMGLGVKMKGDVFAAAHCVSPEDWEGQWIALDCLVCSSLLGLDSHLFYVNYHSTSPVYPGQGELVVCARDGGEGAGSGNTLFVSVSSGPFESYQRLGTLKGNIQSHTCDGSP